MTLLSSRARGAAVALVLPSVLALAGCGESGKEEVQKEVNEICSNFRAETKGLSKDVDNPEAFNARGRRALPAIQKADRELTRVKASEDVRKELGTEYTAFVANFRQTAAVLRGAISAAEQGNGQAVKELGQEIERLDKESDQQAKALGFDECAKG